MRKRNCSFHLRLTENELILLKKRASKCDLSPQQYILSLIENCVPKETPPVEFFEMLKELRQINNNINQIAAKSNAIGFISTEEYRRNVKWLQDSIGKMMEAMY